MGDEVKAANASEKTEGTEDQQHVTSRVQQAQEERRLREAKALRANLMRRKQQQRTRPE
ncbi:MULTISPECIES: hypothetical protein [Neokomagataea]|uniref:Uncharacterized protein n=1 Tax=Neokomagataea anthophila TaxID=2826925 RepID=A0ABS5E8P5_9PROT|nr:MULTISPECIES: hypothetical protein [Neokomagataea]MBR0560256.1 hypothetical protein [Neokomagataea anthophila]